MIENFTEKVTISAIQQLFNEKGYAFFEKGEYNLNIIGIRNPNLQANSFDDTMVVIYKVNKEWVVKVYPITTDAGTYWLENPMNVKGTAILVPDQYRGVYGLRLHLNKYEALCQTWGNVRTYRDNDKDQILEMDDNTITTGMYGINIHRSNPRSESSRVDKWSAGCQVFKKVANFNEFMDICRKARDIWGNKFTYTLIKEEDILK
jgi:hypothetical protein